MPELPVIVAAMGLAELVGDVITSAAIGVEKPHPQAFRHALRGLNAANAWMVGDNPAADVQGALSAGMRATLVRHTDAHGRTVADAVDEILSP
ncbi:MAG: HAD family hydrolase [Acidimicrobiia bacterium]|nr:HAD family hydrolase [Acidimicrobiia bacterium]